MRVQSETKISASQATGPGPSWTSDHRPAKPPCCRCEPHLALRQKLGNPKRKPGQWVTWTKPCGPIPGGRILTHTHLTLGMGACAAGTLAASWCRPPILCAGAKDESQKDPDSMTVPFRLLFLERKSQIVRTHPPQHDAQFCACSADEPFNKRHSKTLCRRLSRLQTGHCTSCSQKQSPLSRSKIRKHWQTKAGIKQHDYIQWNPNTAIGLRMADLPRMLLQHSG